jgi:hypothetical protein
MLRRAHVAAVLAERSAFEPISDKALARLLEEPTSYRAVAAARRWLEREYARDKLAVLRNWIRERRKQ